MYGNNDNGDNEDREQCNLQSEVQSDVLEQSLEFELHSSWQGKPSLQWDIDSQLAE